jgi:transducin (beta)-like 1
VTVSRDDVSVLLGHSSEVFSCAWCPTVPLLASGSADATARLWTVPAVPSTRAAVVDPPVVLAHRSEAKARDVTALDFAADGARLATGSTDGRVRVFATGGQLLQTLEQHRAPVFAVRWNRKGDSLLSASADRTTAIWDPTTGAVKQLFEFHAAPVLDVSWRNDTTFASCSTDGTVIVAQLGALKPIKSWQGHESEVNAVRWDPAGNLAATAGDDMTVKVWNVDKDEPVFDFTDHQREVYTLAWSNTGPGTRNEKLPLVLASASFDGTVRVYDVTLGLCLFALSAPITGPVYTVDFSPDGAHMLTGSFDHSLCTWSARDGALVSTFKCGGGVLDAKFNPSGTKIAACLSDNTIVVLDFVRPSK